MATSGSVPQILVFHPIMKEMEKFNQYIHYMKSQGYVNFVFV